MTLDKRGLRERFPLCKGGQGGFKKKPREGGESRGKSPWLFWGRQGEMAWMLLQTASERNGKIVLTV
jgi:hypothetical protein